MDQTKAKNRINHLFFSYFIILLALPYFSLAQKIHELNSGWFCKNISEVQLSGEQLTQTNSFKIAEWMPAVVPGTVLTTLITNNKVPDPFYGMNNTLIPDIYETGRDHYTYWFYNEFELKSLKKGEQIWLHLRGVNYASEIYLNGKKVNPKTHYGMFLRQNYNITSLLNNKGLNRLAVLVLPPDPVGNPNGGQGGDGVIARNVMHQYVAGWDWIQPVADRNTGIWDKIYIERTGSVNIKNPHIVTKVPGKRFPDEKQQVALIKISVEVQNSMNKPVSGELTYKLNNETLKIPVDLKANETKQILLPNYKIYNPKLWWPNGYGKQNLYTLNLQFKVNGKTLSDEEKLNFGIREITTDWNPFTRSRQIYVNGQKIFIKGGNWIISDVLLRFSQERYDSEIRMHRDMNLNNIRIWGGAITERPEFYQACDKYGLLVMQDFWISGDCNGHWFDPKKKEDQWTRRKYPDDHDLFLRSAADQVKMIRNHASLAFWCGGNELSPPEDILFPLRDTILANLDGTRWFVENSNSDSMSYNFIGGNGDGPYGIQPIERFFKKQTFPFNSEIGSVGVPDFESLKRFIPDNAMVIPGQYQPPKGEKENWRNTTHPVWNYHKYLPYGKSIEKYGKAKNVEDFAFKAQLVNYNQYRALIEGFSTHMWEWYTGLMIWKTQNPWTSMRGQMYDYYLDPNGGLYGLRNGSEALHIFYNPVEGKVMIANNTFKTHRDLMMQVIIYDMQGKATHIYHDLANIFPTSVKRYQNIKRKVESIQKVEGCFMQMRLINKKQEVLSENFYWLPDENGTFKGIQNMAKANIQIKAEQLDKGKLNVSLKNNNLNNPVAFFCRIALINTETGKRILPTFFSDNYISIVPGKEKSIILEFDSEIEPSNLNVRVKGWNVKQQDVIIN